MITLETHLGDRSKTKQITIDNNPNANSINNLKHTKKEDPVDKEEKVNGSERK